MGLGPADIKLYLELWQRGIFKNIKSIIEMGSQEIHLKKEKFEELISIAGITGYEQERFKLLENWPGTPRLSAKPFYEMLGVEKYSCIDLNGKYGAISHDINLPLEDSMLYGQYDLVTDHGTNEHAFNIAETYRTMHRLCKVGGLMVISQMVYKGNGYYLFDSSFFEGLAAANNYSILFSSYVVSIRDDKYIYSAFHIPLSRELLETLDWFKTDSIGICYVLQKQLPSDFLYPYQEKYLSEVQGNVGYKLRFLPEPQSHSYVPIYSEDLQTVKANILLRVLFQRLKDRFKSLFKK